MVTRPTRVRPPAKSPPILADCQDISWSLRVQDVPFVHACEQASHNGELVHAVEAGVLGRDDVAQLGDVLIRIAEGRGSDSDITVFDSTGLAIQDLAIALAAMESVNELDLQMVEL